MDSQGEDKGVQALGDDAIARARTTGQVMAAASDDPQVRIAAHELGKTAVTLTKAINTFLIPLAVMNFAVEKAREYFQSRFATDFAEVAKRIPPEEIVEPKASLAGPLLQALAFSHEEPALKQMYLNPLASAMDGRTAREAHPAFVEIIKQLTSQEAQLLSSTINTDNNLPIVEIRLLLHPRWRTRFGVMRFQILLRHLQSMVKSSTGEASEISNISAIVDNWIRLGLVDVDYAAQTMSSTGGDAYSWVESRPEFRRFQEGYDPKRLMVHKGLIRRTSLGKQFAIAVGISSEGK